MSTLTRVGLYVVALAAAFGLALGVGRVAGPSPSAKPVAHEENEHGEAIAHLPKGLLVSQDGYTLGITEQAPLAFRIEKDGKPVTAYDVEHEKQLHLIVVRRDFAGYQHVHPTLDASGTWHSDLQLPAGAWKVYADFHPTGAEALTLATDLNVAGNPAALATPTSDTEVTLDGELTAGTASTLTLKVTKDGQAVTPEPYLGARGHLVALREGDLAYLHVHPEDGTTFVAEVPSVGAYRLFFDYKVDGQVRTASFVVNAHG